MSATRDDHRGARRAWDRWLFAPEPVAGAVAFRAFLAIWTLAFAIPRLPHLEELYGRTVLRDPALWYRLLGDPVPPGWWLAACAGVLVAALVPLALGVLYEFRTRTFQLIVAVVLSYWLWLDLASARAYGALVVIQWWLLVAAPVGPIADRHGRLRCAPPWGTRLVMLQWSSVYVFAVCAKLAAPGAADGWVTGDALYNIWHTPHYGQFLVSDWLDIGRPVARALGVGVLVAEAIAGVGVWFGRTRRLAIAVAVALHLGMMLTLRVSPLFHALMLGHLVLFADPAAVGRALTRRR